MNELFKKKKTAYNHSFAMTHVHPMFVVYHLIDCRYKTMQIQQFQSAIMR